MQLPGNYSEFSAANISLADLIHGDQFSPDSSCKLDAPVGCSSFDGGADQFLAASICSSHIRPPHAESSHPQQHGTPRCPCGNAVLGIKSLQTCTSKGCPNSQLDNILENWFNSTNPCSMESFAMWQQLYQQATVPSPACCNPADASSTSVCNSSIQPFSGTVSDLPLNASTEALFDQSLPAYSHGVNSLNLEDHLDEIMGTLLDANPTNPTCMSYSRRLESTALRRINTGLDSTTGLLDKTSNSSVYVSSFSSNIADGINAPTLFSGSINTCSAARNCSDYAASVSAAMANSSLLPNFMPSLPNLKVATSDAQQRWEASSSNEVRDQLNAARSMSEKRATKYFSKDEDEESVTFLVESSIPTLDDGYKWCKYGQKNIKDQLHPRSYFKCAQRTCSVKKQTEIFQGYLLITYFGKHNHYANF